MRVEDRSVGVEVQSLNSDGMEYSSKKCEDKGWAIRRGIRL